MGFINKFMEKFLEKIGKTIPSEKHFQVSYKIIEVFLRRYSQKFTKNMGEPPIINYWKNIKKKNTEEFLVKFQKNKLLQNILEKS